VFFAGVGLFEIEMSNLKLGDEGQEYIALQLPKPSQGILFCVSLEMFGF
jgi:hypothetical protein